MTNALSATPATLAEVITKLRRALRTSIRTDYSWESLPMAQVELMQTLNEAGELRIGDLATVMLLAPNTVSSLVQQAVAARRVERIKHPDDGRIAVVRLTEHGSSQLKEWIEAHEYRLSAALAELSAKDRSGIFKAVASLDRLTTKLNELKERG